MRLTFLTSHMRIAIIKLREDPSTDHIKLALSKANMTPVELEVSQSQHFSDYDGYVLATDLPHQFGVRPGIMAAKLPFMQVLREQVNAGKPFLAMGKGAPILIESGIVPGIEAQRLAMGVTYGDEQEQWLSIKLTPNFQRNAFTKYLHASDILNFPLRFHAKFVVPEALWVELKHQGLAIFQEHEQAFNQEHILAMANKKGNALACFFSPEEAECGELIFKSMHDYISQEHSTQVKPLQYAYRVFPPKPHSHQGYEVLQEHDLLIDLKPILNISCFLKPYEYWQTDQPEIYHKLLMRELSVTSKVKAQALFLVREQEDKVLEKLCKEMNCKLDTLTHGVLWAIISEEVLSDEVINQILDSYILYNPFTANCYRY